MEFQGTKGEWKYKLSGYALKDIGLKYTISSEDVFISEVKTDIGMQSDVEVLANAKLIAASPELLKALQFMVSRFDADDNKFSQRLAIIEAKEAIEKALN